MVAIVWTYASFFPTHSYAKTNSKCDFKTSDFLEELADIGSVKAMEVRVKKQKKWTINALRILTDSAPNILPKHKRNFKADVKVIYPFGACEYAAKIRQNGDHKDHIVYSAGRSILQSLNVKLQEGNVAHFVKFKLFLPKTRQAENEVIFSTLLRKFGYLSPRTKLVVVKVNGRKQPMLLQENAAKEALEYNGRREGPIFEGDERLLWGWQGRENFSLGTVSLSRLVNNKWAANGHSSLSIASEAFIKLQSTYLKYSNDPTSVFLDWNLLTNGSAKSIRKWSTYEILTMAAGGSHALRPHNRKFYWNSFEESFEPIYYDGNVGLTFSMLFLKKALSWYADVLRPNDFETVRQQLKTINATEFSKQLIPLGVEKSAENVAAILESLVRGVSELEAKIALVKSDKISNPEQIDYVETLSKRFRELVPGAKVRALEKLDFFNANAKISTCSVSTDICKSDRIKFDNLVAVMGGDYMVNDLPAPIAHAAITSRNELQKLVFDEGAVKLRASNGMQVEYDKSERRLSFTQSKAEDWVVIYDSKLSDLTIEIDGLDASKFAQVNGQRFNRFGLTGCLNIYGSEFSNTSVSAVDGTCEDSINIVNGSGSVKKLSVTRSLSDAIDIDFSKITIEDVVVVDAGNDCFDVSSGDYELGAASLNNCGDKGVSVGEASKFRSQKLHITNAAIGVSSKDSSNTIIERLTAKNVTLCAEAFKKKQEFHAGKLELKTSLCGGNRYQADTNSQIMVGGEAQ